MLHNLGTLQIGTLEKLDLRGVIGTLSQYHQNEVNEWMPLLPISINLTKGRKRPLSFSMGRGY